jgi:hypothetical protein
LSLVATEICLAAGRISLEEGTYLFGSKSWVWKAATTIISDPFVSIFTQQHYQPLQVDFKIKFVSFIAM